MFSDPLTMIALPANIDAMMGEIRLWNYVLLGRGGRARSHTIFELTG